MTVRVAITGGKTGGHVFPALAVAECLLPRLPALSLSTPEIPTLGSDRTAELLYIGFAGGVEERVVPQAAIPLLALRLTTPDSWFRMPRAALDITRAFCETVLEFRTFRPHALFSTGGFVSLPAVCSAWLRRTPIVVFLPDVRPGRTVRLTSFLARRLAVSSEDSLAYLARGVRPVVTGYPVRSAFLNTDKARARTELGLPTSELQLLVMGGSLGSRSINEAIASGLSEILPIARVMHICGRAHEREMENVRRRLPEDLRGRYSVHGYLGESEMATAMFASDLAVSRAGASILGELPITGLPAIVVPLPAQRVGQEENARALARHDACLVVPDHHAPTGELVRAVLNLLRDRDMRLQISSAVSKLARPSAARALAELVVDEAIRGQ